jgi:glycosyltransferase involved in cell wall biosynthesis
MAISILSITSVAPPFVLGSLAVGEDLLDPVAVLGLLSDSHLLVDALRDSGRIREVYEAPDLDVLTEFDRRRLTRRVYLLGGSAESAAFVRAEADRIPGILCFDDPSPLHRPLTSTRNKIERRASPPVTAGIDKAYRVVLPSKAARLAFIEDHPKQRNLADKTVVIPRGTSSLRSSIASRAALRVDLGDVYGLDTGLNWVLSPDRVGEQFLSLEVARAVGELDDDSIALLFIAAVDGPPTLLAEIAEAALPATAVFVTDVDEDDRLGFFKVADAAICLRRPSIKAATSEIGREAFRCGTALVCTRDAIEFSDLPESLTDKVDYDGGFEAASAALEEVLSRPDLQMNRDRRNRWEWVDQRWDYAVVADQYLDLIQEVWP